MFYDVGVVSLHPSAECPAPNEPNVSVSGLTSASVGSEVTYHWDTGLTLVGERVAICISDGTKWVRGHVPTASSR